MAQDERESWTYDFKAPQVFEALDQEGAGLQLGTTPSIESIPELAPIPETQEGKTYAKALPLT